MAVWHWPARFHSGADHDRVVFDLTETPLYTVRESADGQQITLDFTEVGLRHFQNQAFQSKRIKAVSYRQQKDHFLVTLSLPAGMTYKVSNLHQPARVFIDILPKVIQQPKPAAQAANPATPVAPQEPENTYTQELAPGIWQKTCVYWDDDGKVSAWFIIADHKRYQVKPALGRGKIPGRETVQLEWRPAGSHENRWLSRGDNLYYPQCFRHHAGWSCCLRYGELQRSGDAGRRDTACGRCGL